MLLIVLEMTRFVFSCVYHNFRVLLILLVWGNFFFGGDIHMVGGKDWSFKIVMEKINAKDKWQLIKGCGSFFLRGGLEWQSDMFLCIVGWFISTMDSGLLGQAVQYHGPELVRCLQIEQQQVPVSLTDHLNKYRQRQPNTSRSEQFLRNHFKITA